MRCLRCLRDLEKWSWVGKMGKNGAKIGKNGCTRIPIYTLLIAFYLLSNVLTLNLFRKGLKDNFTHYCASTTSKDP